MTHSALHDTLASVMHFIGKFMNKIEGHHVYRTQRQGPFALRKLVGEIDSGREREGERER